MTAHDQEMERKPPTPPSPHLIAAVALELSMLAVFIVHHAWSGVGLAALYFYWSATCRALFTSDDEP